MAKKPERFIFDTPLAESDPDVAEVIDLEEERQANKIILIASESICPPPVRKVLDSVFNNVYAEGYPSPRQSEYERDLLLDYEHMMTHHRRYSDRRYYKGTEFCDFVEALAQKRLAELFATENVPAEQIYCNVQPLSGAAANNAVYDAFLQPGDVVLGLDLTHGGHLTHGSDANRSGQNYEVVPYQVDRSTSRLNYDKIRELALEHEPRLIIAGYSAYPWAPDFAKFREIADEVGAILLADIAHTAGMAVAGAYPNPIEHAHIISFTTHKTMCGPRGACLVSAHPEVAELMHAGVFPGEQGGPHIHQIAAKAVSFKIAQSPEFKKLMKKVVENALHLAKALEGESLTLAYGGTDTHMCLIDLKKVKTPTGITLTGEIASRILDLCHITLNKNTIMDDDNAAHPTAIRLGTTWVTQRGMGKREMEKIASLVARALKNMHPFSYIETSGLVGRGKIDLDIILEIRKEVAALCEVFPGDVGERDGKPYPFYYLGTQETPKSSLAGTLEEHGANMKGGFAVDFGDANGEAKAALEGAAVIDCSNLAPLEIIGIRATQFLQGVCTADISKLEVGQCTLTFLLDKEGGAFADAHVTRFKLDERGRDWYLLVAGPNDIGKVKTYLRAVSDGYVIFDEDDVTKKIEGPVIVRDLREESKGTLLALSGPGAPGILSKHSESLGDVGADSYHEGTIDGQHIGMLSCGQGEHVLCYILADPLHAGELFDRLAESGAKAAGTAAFEAVRRSYGLPDYSKEHPAASALVGQFPEAFGLSKHYFAGQSKLLELAPKAKKEEFEWKEPKDAPLKHTALFDEHCNLTKKDFIVPFAGWEMPVWYTRVSEEHKAVRETAGLFDVSHMGLFEFKGPHAEKFLDTVLSNYVPFMRDGQAMYSYCCGPDGNVIDDTFTYRLNRHHFWMVVNASNNDKMWAWLTGVNEHRYLLDREITSRDIEGEVELRNLKDSSAGADRMVNLALQGPMSLDILQALTDDPVTQRNLDVLQWSTHTWAELAGVKALLARTGYTGEKIAYEVYVPWDDAVGFWNELLEIGENFGLVPCGLGARDSTRTEAGLPLYGHELAGHFDISPIAAGYGAFVKFHKPFFVGRKALLENEKARRMEVVRWQLLDKDVRTLHTGDPVASKRAKHIGWVTSAVLVEGFQMGLAYVDRRFSEPGTKLEMFPLTKPEQAAKEKAKPSLQPGDMLLVSGEAEVLTRWPEEDEEEEIEEIFYPGLL